jgi:hypothetical protein
MTLIERYLHAVRAYLPASRQTDIIRELSDDLASHVAEREEAEGRPLTDAEVEDLLKRYGHPVVLASKYGPQRHLIGTPLFPTYLKILKISLAVGLIVQVALAIARIATGAPFDEALQRVVTFPFGTAIYVFGWVTLGFALVDAAMGELRLRAWNPRELPMPGHAPVRARGGLIAELVASTFFFLWWLAVPQHPFLILGPAAGILALAPVWQTIYAPATVLWALSLVMLWMMILRPDWARFRRATKIVTNLGGMIVAGILLRADRLIVPLDANVATGTLQAIEAGARIGLMIFVVAAAVEVAKAALMRQNDDG